MDCELIRGPCGQGIPAPVQAMGSGSGVAGAGHGLGVRVAMGLRSVWLGVAALHVMRDPWRRVSGCNRSRASRTPADLT